MDSARAIIVVAVIVGETARAFECLGDISLGFTARNDDGETLFDTNVPTMMAPC